MQVSPGMPLSGSYHDKPEQETSLRITKPSFGLYHVPPNKSQFANKNDQQNSTIDFGKSRNDSDNVSDNKATMILAFDPKNDLGISLRDKQDRNNSLQSDNIEN